MRNKNWDLVFIVIGILNVGYSFIGNNATTDLFGFEMNIWIFRAIWICIAIASFFGYKKKKKLESEATQK